MWQGSGTKMIDVQPGRYVVAVSGGVDSVVLLHLLYVQYSGLDGYHFVVAHYDHGIRQDSKEDRRLVQHLANLYNMPFVYDEGHLGSQASEATAREARYTFLRTVKKTCGADAIMTAHHQDDVIETAFLNLLRGTGRKGLTSLRSSDDVLRPLLHVSKQDIIVYAQNNRLTWREDSTNTDLRYKRNYIRHQVVNKLSDKQREELLVRITKMHKLNQEIDRILDSYLNIQLRADVLHRKSFTQLPHDIAKESVAAWLRKHQVRDFDTKGLERIVVAAKTYQSGQQIDVNKDWIIRVEKDTLALKHRDR